MAKTSETARSVAAAVAAAARAPRVLVVEDDPDMLCVITASLVGLWPDLDLETAPDGRRAMKRLVEFKPHLLLTDLQMPEMSGLELCRWARQNRELSETRIVVVTGHDSPPVRAAAWEGGVDAYLPKPFTPGDLRMLASELLPKFSRTRGAVQEER